MRRVVDLSKYYENQPRQTEFHLCPSKYRLYGGAMSGGKTFAGCAEAIKQSLKYPGNRGLIGRATLRALRRTTLVSFFRICPPELIASYNKTDMEVTLVNGSVIIFSELNRSADPRLEKIRSLELGWFFIDEASEVDGEYFAALTTRLRWMLPNGRRPRYTGFMGTNPEIGWCYEGFVVRGNDAQRAFIPALPEDNRFNTEEYLEDMKRNLTDQDLQRFFYGNWMAIDDPAQLISYQWVKLAHDSEILLATDLALGVDVARFGSDNTALTLLTRTDDEYMAEVKTTVLPSTRTTEVADHVAGLMMEFHIPPHKIVVDAVGLGAGVVDSLHEKGIECLEFIGGAKPLWDDTTYTYKNLRSQGYWYLRNAFRDNNIALQLDSRRLRELTTIRYSTSGERMIEVEQKDKIKSRLEGRSPDLADSLMMAVMAYYMEETVEATGAVFG